MPMREGARRAVRRYVQDASGLAFADDMVSLSAPTCPLGPLLFIRACQRAHWRTLQLPRNRHIDLVRRGDLMDWLYRHRAFLTFLGVLAAGFVVPGASDSWAQKRKAPPLVAKEAPGSRQPEIRREQQPGAKESVEADVSARN